MHKFKSIFYGWWIVIACAAGLAVSPGPVAFYSLGVLIQPLSESFGWERSDVALTTTILTSALVITAPFIGALIDRIGPKRVLLVSMALFAAGLWSITLVDSLIEFYIGYAFIGVGGAGANSLAYMKLLSSWFNRRRGLALGIASAGMGLGFAVVPSLTQYGIDVLGWKGAYLALGSVILIFGIPNIAWFVRNNPEQMNLLPDGETIQFDSRPTELLSSGVSVAQAMKMRQYWILLCIFFPVGGVIYAMAVHLVPIIKDLHNNADLAIQAATSLGIAMMIGRVVAGYLFDKFFAPMVCCLVFLAAAAGIIILLFVSNPFWIILASMMIGFCSGAEGDALAYLMSRYFGLLAYGKIYSHAFIAVMLGIATFPYIMALDFDQAGSYTRTLSIYAALLGAGAILLLFLGPFPCFEKARSRFTYASDNLAS